MTSLLDNDNTFNRKKTRWIFLVIKYNQRSLYRSVASSRKETGIDLAEQLSSRLSSQKQLKLVSGK